MISVVANSIPASGTPSLDEASSAVPNTPRPLAGEVAERSAAGEGDSFLVRSAMTAAGHAA